MKEKLETINESTPHSYLCNISDRLANKTPTLTSVLSPVLMCNTTENQANVVNQPLLGDAFKSTSICIEEISARELGSSFTHGYPL